MMTYTNNIGKQSCSVNTHLPCLLAVESQTDDKKYSFFSSAWFIGWIYIFANIHHFKLSPAADRENKDDDKFGTKKAE